MADTEETPTREVRGSEHTPDSGGSVRLGTAWMGILSLLLFWLPTLGPLIAGYVGGKKAGGVMKGILAAVLPGILLALIIFFGGTFLADMPVVGAILGGAALIGMVIHVFPLMVGGIIGGALA